MLMLPFKVGYEGIKDACQGMKGLNLTTGQKILAGLTLSELTLYLTANKDIGEMVSGLICDTVVTNIAGKFETEDLFVGDRLKYNNLLAAQDAIINKMPPVINAVARLFSAFKGNWINWAPALVCGLMGKSEAVCIAFKNDGEKRAFSKNMAVSCKSQRHKGFTCGIL